MNQHFKQTTFSFILHPILKQENQNNFRFASYENIKKVVQSKHVRSEFQFFI